MNTPDTPTVPLERRAPHAPPDGARLVSTAEYGGAVCSLYRFGDHEALWGRVVAPGMSLAGLLSDLLAFDVAIGKAVDALDCTAGRLNTATRAAVRDGVTDFEICAAMIAATMQGQADRDAQVELGANLIEVINGGNPVWKVAPVSTKIDPTTVPGASLAPECSPAQRALEPVETSGGRVEGPR